MTLTPERADCCGFTLVEIMIVIAIIGLLASIAIPSWIKSRQNARVSVILAELRVFEDAVQQFAMASGSMPAAGTPVGVVPPEIQGFFKDERWTDGCPASGDYEWLYYAAASEWAIFINNGPDVEIMQAVDKQLDDGNLATGRLLQDAGLDYAYLVK